MGHFFGQPVDIADLYKLRFKLVKIPLEGPSIPYKDCLSEYVAELC